MEKYEISVPTPRIFESFDEATSPLYRRVIANIHESKVLATTRDLLLPKLMSGEVRVKDAEKIAEATA
jgi:type I restriction enzyme, S subunit